MQGRAIKVRGRQLPYPAVCAPLVARTADALVAECTAVAAKQPDVIEWRVDFFGAIADTGAVLDTAKRLKIAAAGVPILFTRRHSREGGEAIALAEPQVVELYRAVCASGAVDLVDFEMGNDPAHVDAVRDCARAAAIPLVLSFHDFRSTPSADEIVAKFQRGHSLGADVVKIAVMPKSEKDVLALLGATARASRALPIPVISMAMGPLGAVTRAAGWLFGSALTFAVGASSSAPGQMAIEDVRSVIAALKRAQ